MHRIHLLLLSAFYTSMTFAASSYQVDVILFTHPVSASRSSEAPVDTPLIPIAKNAIALKTGAVKSASNYSLLSPLKSNLKDEYYRLSHKRQYTVLAQYSWIQPLKSQNTVAIPVINRNGWQVQGTVRVRQSNYYLLDSDLQISPPNAPQTSYTVSQKQRLKANVVYYLDHPTLGMLIKVHPLS